MMAVLGLGSAEDRAAELSRLAEVDSWYDRVYAAAKRVDPVATISKHNTLATISVQGRSLLLTGYMWDGDQRTGKTPDQRIREFLASVEVQLPTFAQAPDPWTLSAQGVPILSSRYTQPSTSGAVQTSVQTSILQTAAKSLGLDSGWVESNKWLLIAAAAAAAYLFLGRGK